MSARERERGVKLIPEMEGFESTLLLIYSLSGVVLLYQGYFITFVPLSVIINIHVILPLSLSIHVYVSIICAPSSYPSRRL